MSALVTSDDRPFARARAPKAENIRGRFPESMLADTFPTDRRPRLVSAMPGVPLKLALSGSTYHLALGGVQSGAFDGCFTICSGLSNDLGASALASFWAGWRRIAGKSAGGFKFSTDLNDYLWARLAENVAGCDIIHTFQMSGKRLWRDGHRLGVRSYFYVDGTLSEYFNAYAAYDVAHIGQDTMRSAIAHERESYHDAKHIIAMSKATAASLRDEYGIPADRISITMPSANLTDEQVAFAKAMPPREPNGEFNVGFIGLYPERKGLDRLAKAVQICRGRGLPIRLTVVGRQLDWMNNLDFVTYEGLINKHQEPERFVRVVKGFDIGCQLSHAELTGIALCEYLRLGVPALGTKTGGATDIMEGGGSVMVEADITPEELAGRLALLLNDTGAYRKIKDEALARQDFFDWRRAALDIAKAVESS